jgi:ABC-type antimicrobial peptide transport system permease subunit
LRALGATPGDAAALVLWEAAVVGLAGGLLGLGGALGAARVADRVALRLLPAFPGRPETLFALSPTLAAAALGLALFSALAGALAPARLAARLDPARSLQG